MAYTDKERTADYKIVFGTPVGRKVLTDILVKGNVFNGIDGDVQTFSDGTKEYVPLTNDEAMRREGMRRLALQIASFIRFNADSYMDHWKQPEE